MRFGQGGRMHIGQQGLRAATWIADQTHQVGLAHGWRQGAQVLTVERQDVEGVGLDLLVVPARVQGVEVGDAVDPQHHGFAVDDEAVLWKSVNPIVAAPRDQAHAISLALQAYAVSVVLRR